MGRIKTTLIKRNAEKLYSKHPKKFKKSFDENKKIVQELTEISSKKLRNILAGYITKLANQQE